MAIMTDERGNILVDFMPANDERILEVSRDAPLTHALIVVKVGEGEGVLFLFNKWRKGWELPGGIIEKGETARQCVIRELLEETNQIAQEVTFRGLMKFRLQPDFHGPERTEYGALYDGKLDGLRDFTENDEAEKIMLWTDGRVERMEAIDRKLAELVK